MSARIVAREKDYFTIQIEVPYGDAMLAAEEVIQDKLNEAGALMTGEVLRKFDTDGSPIVHGGVKWTSKGLVSKPYQTLYGEAVIERHVYQTSQGGRMFCPLEKNARIILTATPKFAKTVASKYAEMGASRVMEDLAGNHGRKIARCYMQDLCDAIGAVVFAKEQDWNYALPELEKPVRSVSVGLDGTCLLMVEGGFRQTMVGTIALYDKDGERQHTLYTAAAPEYGKATFLARLTEEVERVKSKFPDAIYLGLADGAKENWDFLNIHTTVQIVDFWHAAGYLGRAAEVMFKGKTKSIEKARWLEQACHHLKHKPHAAGKLLREMEAFTVAKKRSPGDLEEIQAAISYFANNKKRMNYAHAVENNWAIGSGVTEAACKVIVKQRLGGAGMKWGSRGAAVVLTLRALNHSAGRWDQFWKKIEQYGLPPPVQY